MVKVILGSALGGLVAGGIALMAAGQAQSTRSFADPMGMPIAQTVAQSAPSSVQCAPHQQAVMARVMMNGREATTLACVDRVNDGMAYYQPAQPMMAAPQAYAQPVTYVPVQTPAPVQARPAARRVTYREDDTVRYEPDTKKRSIAKTAMIIGGSAGAGAGVGAIAGGKKGALIGAAIGGGAASIYEATKR
jgi:hypothetical protein